MMWGYGQDMGRMCLWVPALLIGIALLVLLAVTVFARGIRNEYGPPGTGAPPPAEGSRARRILEEHPENASGLYPQSRYVP